MQPNATKNAVIAKINTLRGGFRRELKKIQNSKRSGAGTEDVYVYDVCKLSNETGNVAPDLATERRPS
ncbi:hypothetical protein NQ318_015874 [Aromia moschata]|uniref:Uncharacterized protein n=1 Tax=Aromia moschata TaxID=1265417 RepID=A0AAV8YRM1_9CUCU|nr:hypothetical protein NQ318_015874 [Aromia moschata]